MLEDHITWLDQNGIDRQLKGKAKFLWNESEVKELNNYLNSKANALHSLLTAVQSRTSFDRNQLLQKPESQKVFRKVEDGRSSLSVFKSRSGTSAETSSSHVAFDFDKEIAATNVHRNVTIPPDDEQ
ncbi:putative gpa1 [Botrytis fragariae]|uniref:Putative gpa1 n=1 Tax=Botrytis fragariae TaxID=1964551 RepID=A0A8H6B0Y9_9HELO|nr:putative gpa1 [Botrytis fragariae]KAF5877159.1 putative gpa1 [Botrytis fragariae]